MLMANTVSCAEMTTTRYAYLQQLHHVHNLRITLRGDLRIPGPESSSPTLAEYFALLANILKHVHASKLRRLTLDLALTSYQEPDPAHRANIARTLYEFGVDTSPGYLPLEDILRNNLTREDVLGNIREVERIILQFPVLIAMCFDIASPITRMWDGLVEQMFPNLQKKGMLRTIRPYTGEYTRVILG